MFFVLLSIYIEERSEKNKQGQQENINECRENKRSYRLKDCKWDNKLLYDNTRFLGPRREIIWVKFLLSFHHYVILYIVLLHHMGKCGET